MIAIEGSNSHETSDEVSTTDLATARNGRLAMSEQVAASLSVGMLEQALLARFPAEDAEPWDRTGLLVGDPSKPVQGVAVALDPTGAAIDAAVVAGANVLLTHHPAFLEPPAVFSPSHARATAAGANVFKAIESGVALVNFHTALDVSREATRLLPELLGLDFDHVLVPSGDDPAKGYGQSCRIRSADTPFKLAHLAARCVSVFGREPRVWGDRSQVLDSVVVANGSAGNVVEASVRAHASCLVCGEIRYHAALDASQAGLCIVELGHDVSELPLTALLAQATIDAGVPAARVSLVDQSSNWSIPDSTRVEGASAVQWR